MKVFKIAVAGMALLSAAALAQEATSLQSDWIELVKGHKGQTLGVELRDIQSSDSDGMQTVTLAVPRGAIANTDFIEEVVVTARAPAASEPMEPIKVEYQWLNDYDEDNYGLVIRIGKGNWPIRLYLNSSAGFIGDQQIKAVLCSDMHPELTRSAFSVAVDVAFERFRKLSGIQTTRHAAGS